MISSQFIETTPTHTKEIAKNNYQTNKYQSINNQNNKQHEKKIYDSNSSVHAASVPRRPAGDEGTDKI